MPFLPGSLCCSNIACALVKTDGQWEKPAHQTEVGFDTQATTTGVVTSDTNGREGKSCGTVATTGTLGLACHDGDPMRLAVNTRYRIRFSDNCSNIWEDESVVDDGYGSPIAVPEAGTYYEGIILITSEPYNLNISASEIPITVYNWELDGDWIAQPETLPADISDDA
jgi:hypothetical protein